MSESTTGAKILSGASLSGSIDLIGFLLAGIQMPTGWTAASITFQASVDGTTFQDVYDTEGNEYTIASAGAAASRFIALDPRDFAGVRFLKIRSGSSAAAVNQGADRTFGLALTRG